MKFYCSKCWRKPCACKFIEGKPEHEYTFAALPGGMLDQVICSCGWESHTYFDGAEYAVNDWKKHAASSTLPSQQGNCK